MKILFLVNQLLTVCGVTKHFYYLIIGLKKYYPENEYYVITGGGNAINKFTDAGINVNINKNILHETRSIRKFLIGTIEIINFVRKNRINIIHSHHHYSANIAFKASIFTGSNTVMTNHGLLPEIGRLDHFAAKYIITVNDYGLNYIVKNKIKDKKHVFRINLGFPIRNFEKVRKDKLKVIAGGRFVVEKGFDNYIRAVAKLDPKLKNKAEFFIAGEGPEKKNLLKLNEKLNSPVNFLGVIEDFQKKLVDTDIFVMPSKSKSEGFPTVLIEAGITKNLIIVSDFLGLRNYFNEKYGLIYEQNNLSRLIDLLSESILNFELHKNKIFNFYEFIEGEFDLEGMVRKTNNLYLSILKNG